MKTHELLILTLAHSDKGMIAGRTLFQKTVYFLNEKLKLGLDFIPYYYGPYSTEVTEVISSLRATDIVKEEFENLSPFNFNVTLEPRLYMYQLTKIGGEIASLIKSKQRGQAKKIENILKKIKELGAADDYKTLSIAAKMYHILRIEKKLMTTHEILKEAQVLKWEIHETEAKAAIKFLEGMELIKVKTTK